jgi:SpoIID/LytB domain protein
MFTIRPTYHRLCTGLAHGAASGLVSLSAALVIAGTSVAVLPASAGAAQTQELVITGAGDGHGVGMSQDGALGYAEHGWSYKAILAHYYTGTAIGQAPSGTIVRVLVGSKVQDVPLERYVRGVVSAEMPAGWPLAALEAQAIASRTYALTSDAGGSRFDVYSDTRSQVYRGPAAETAQTNAAVADTAGQIVTYGGHPAVTYFFASSGGMTESVQNGFPGATPEPWLRGVQDSYEAASRSDWKVTLSFATVAKRLQGLVNGQFRGIEVLTRGYSPRIVTAAVLGSAGKTDVSGPELESRLGLQSTWAYFAVLGASGQTQAEPDRSGWKDTGETGGPAPEEKTSSPAPGEPSKAPAPSQPVSVEGAAGAPGQSGTSPAGGSWAE